MWLLSLLLAHAEPAAPRPGEVPGFPNQLPPLRASLGDDAALQLGLLNQFLAVLDVPQGEQVTLTPSIRRLRADLRGTFARGYLQFRVQLDLAPDRLELLDYTFESTLHPKAAIRLGVSKVPFTRYRDQNVGLLHFVDWALTTRAFGSERQFGLSVHDNWTHGPTYAIGLFTGTNTRASHGLGVADAYGTEVTNPSRFTDFEWPGPMHAEVVGRIGWSSPGATPMRSVDREGGAPRVTALASFAVDSAPVPGLDLAARVAPEVFVQGRRVSATALWYGGWFVDRDGAWTFGLSGVHGELTWAAHRWIEIGVRYAHVLRLPALEADVRAVTGQDPNGPTLQQEVGVGWGSPMIGDAFDWSTDVRYVDGLQGRGLVVRSQIQVAI